MCIICSKRNLEREREQYTEKYYRNINIKQQKQEIFTEKQAS